MICTKNIKTSRLFQMVEVRIISLFYVILLVAIFHAIKKFLDEPTAFEENHISNAALKIPSFTMCPYPNDLNEKPFESFEDIQNGIKRAKMNWKGGISFIKSFEENQ